ncbi:MAG: GIY-YIG nuclease family protein [Bdellovibrio sp.]
MGAANIISKAKTLEFLKGSYVYFLLNQEVVVYVGKSDSLLSRIGQHQRDKDFDTIKYIPVIQEDQGHLENALIKALRPKLNSQSLVKVLLPQEAEALKKYATGQEILKAMIKSKPSVGLHEYGFVAFFNDKEEIVFGYYDDDEYEKDDDEHDDDCRYIGAKICLGEIEDELDDQLSEFCKCEPHAIVLDKGGGYYTVNRSELFNLDHEDFDQYMNEFYTTLIDNLGKDETE